MEFVYNFILYCSDGVVGLLSWLICIIMVFGSVCWGLFFEGGRRVWWVFFVVRVLFVISVVEDDEGEWVSEVWREMGLVVGFGYFLIVLGLVFIIFGFLVVLKLFFIFMVFVRYFEFFFFVLLFVVFCLFVW